MSASRDQSQTAPFIISHFYELYREKNAARNEGSPASGLVLKSGCVRSVSAEESKAIGSWSRAEDIHHGKKSLATQLSELRSARKRLSFLIQEVDELLKKA